MQAINEIEAPAGSGGAWWTALVAVAAQQSQLFPQSYELADAPSRIVNTSDVVWRNVCVIF